MKEMLKDTVAKDTVVKAMKPKATERKAMALKVAVPDEQTDTMPVDTLLRRSAVMMPLEAHA